MIKLTQILLEGLSIYEVEILIKTARDANKVDIYNSIRAIEGVVVCKVEQNSYLDTLTSEQAEYSLLHMKYLVHTDPTEDIKLIKKRALITHKIPGLLKFVFRLKTLEKKTAL